jgi:hypothetical protein
MIDLFEDNQNLMKLRESSHKRVNEDLMLQTSLDVVSYKPKQQRSYSY